uniref:Uncharacterized protein n=1 Tax=Timema tahoe TaxID=61484 RepID=A0A7R9IU27_9NEOP|nr:unnamed protein product [Timema tahoe]
MDDVCRNGSANNDDANIISSSNTPYDEKERAHFNRIVSAFRAYRAFSLLRIVNTEKYFLSLPVNHRALLKSFRDNLDVIRTCIEKNNNIIKLIVKDVAYMFENVSHTLTCSTNQVK